MSINIELTHTVLFSFFIFIYFLGFGTALSALNKGTSFGQIIYFSTLLLIIFNIDYYIAGLSGLALSLIVLKLQRMRYEIEKYNIRTISLVFITLNVGLSFFVSSLFINLKNQMNVLIPLTISILECYVSYSYLIRMDVNPVTIKHELDHYLVKKNELNSQVIFYLVPIVNILLIIITMYFLYSFYPSVYDSASDFGLMVFLSLIFAPSVFLSLLLNDRIKN